MIITIRSDRLLFVVELTVDNNNGGSIAGCWEEKNFVMESLKRSQCIQFYVLTLARLVGCRVKKLFKGVRGNYVLTNAE